MLYLSPFFFQTGHGKNVNFDAASSICANFDEIHVGLLYLSPFFFQTGHGKKREF